MLEKVDIGTTVGITGRNHLKILPMMPSWW
jgi:hypothetical protein